MKNFIKIVVLLVLSQNMVSCAYFFNERTVEVAIESTPPGADIIIGGRSYGKTPKIVRIEPSNHVVTLNKAGHGTAQIQLEAWQAVRSDKSEGARCIADAVGTMLVLPALSYWSIYCRDFKQDKYSVAIPYTGPVGTSPNSSYNNSQRGNYQQYYGQRMNNGTAQQPRRQPMRGAPQQQKSYDVLQGGEYYDNRSYTDDSFGNPGSF